MIINLIKEDDEVYVKTKDIDMPMSLETIVLLSREVLKIYNKNNDEKFEVNYDIDDDDDNLTLESVKMIIEELIDKILSDDESLDILDIGNNIDEEIEDY